MQKRLFIIGAGALALAAPLFLVSCASDNPSDSGKVQPADEMVKTSFTLSVGLPGGGSTNNAKGHVGTRMSEDVTQAQGTPVFRGIDNISLIPFEVSGEGVDKTASRNGDKNIVLPNATVNSLAKDQITGTGNAHVYNDVSVPTGTNAFLFYGKAIDATAGTAITTSSDKFLYGTLKAKGLDAGVPSGITFTPEPIAANPSTTVGNKIATYLTSIANAKTTNGKAWSAVKADASTGQGKALADLYANFITMTAGSSKNIQLAVQDLYMILRGYSEGDEDLKDTESARKLLQHARESGMPEYQVCLGADAENSEDHKKAFACYRKAALNGSSIGALLAAECLMNGIGTDTDYYRAGWYLWIASLGGALYISQSAAGLLAAGGLGRERDPDLGFRLFMHEARFGNVECGKAAAGCLPLVQDADPADVSWLTGLFYELAHGSVEYALTYAGLLLYGGRPVKALAFAEAAEESGVEGAAEFAAGLRQRVGIIGRICAWFLARSLYGKFNREA